MTQSTIANTRTLPGSSLKANFPRGIGGAGLLANLSAIDNKPISAVLFSSLNPYSAGALSKNHLIAFQSSGRLRSSQRALKNPEVEFCLGSRTTAPEDEIK